ncbi:NYN domain-containing protein [Nocardioides panacisoli]|uniref:NYN domain-containing protein n=1 Tax=Nocardioides panacisoli TaxID=627624 RepID=UPI001C62A22A|nr:NYN domain-containing protein [Nocardioides panacisoli]QYJ03993.1 NYN domain-containing protein [Nocardioides panacisoli]
MSPETTRLAVLIDADNTSAKHVSALLDELAAYGVTTVKRAYGDWTTPQLGGWKPELSNHAIEPIQQFSYTTGKNATDSALIIDAMDLLYSDNLDAFALVSSDSDFTGLAIRLRRSGKTVYGLGLRKTPQSLVAACDKFIYLEVLGEGEEEGSSDEAPALPDLRRLLTRAVNSRAGDDHWAHLGSVGQYLNSASANFDSRNYGYPKLISLVQDQDFLDVEHEDGKPARVRLRSQRPAKKASKKAAAKGAAKATKKATKSAAKDGARSRQ